MAFPLSLSITLDYRVLLVLLVLVGLAAYAAVYRFYLTKYERLPKQPPKAAGTSFDLHPDASTDDTKSLPKNYAEEFLGSFLQSIKVFGYIEQPVFHELAKRLQTRKLPAGDILFHSDDSPSDDNFYIVVEGCVQVFVRSLHQNDDEADAMQFAPPPILDSIDEMDNTLANHHLLHEVQPGGNVSSLFTILSLFTEHISGQPVPARAPMHQPASGHSDSANMPGADDGSPQNGLNLVAQHFARPDDSPPQSEKASVFPHLGGTYDDNGQDFYEQQADERMRSGSSHHRAPSPAPTARSARPHLHTTAGSRRGDHHTSGASPYHFAPQGVPTMPDMDASFLAPGVTEGMTARAAVDTTLVVIPAEAFLRLREKFPHAAAHIALVILTRFQRVTQLTMNKYLGLSKEVLKIEQHVNNAGSTTVSIADLAMDSGEHNLHARHRSRDYLAPTILPSDFFWPGGLDRLRRRFHMSHSVYRHKASAGSAATPESSVAAFGGSTGAPSLAMNSGISSARIDSIRGDTGTAPRPRKRTTTFTNVTNRSINDIVPENAANGTGTPLASPTGSRRASTAGITLMSSQTAELTMPHAASAGVNGLASASVVDPASASSFSGDSASSDENFEFNVHAYDDPEEEAHLRSSTYQMFMRYLGLHIAPLGENGAEAEYPGHSPMASPATPVSQHTPRGRFGPSPIKTSGQRGASANRLLTNYGAASSTLQPVFQQSHHSSRSSINTTSTASSSVTSNVSEMDSEDVEIRFCRQGTVLVKAGERLPGMYLVVDGLLAVGAPPPQTNADDTRASRLQRMTTHPPSGGLSSAPVPNADGKRDFSADTMPPYSYRPPMGMSELLNAATANSTAKYSSPPIGGRAVPHSPTARTQAGAAAASRSSSANDTYLIRPGGVAGYLAALTGYPSLVTVRAQTDCCVAFVSKQALDRLIDRHPIVILTLAKRLINYLLHMRPASLVLHIDIALDWMQVNAGQICHRQGDPSDAIYIVLNGRLRNIEEKNNGSFEIVGEYGQGESVGELEVLMETLRPSTLHAIRDTELARMPKTLFNALALRHPEITLSIARIIASRTSQHLDSSRLSQQHRMALRTSSLPDFGKNNMNLRTVALIPAGANVPIRAFAEQLRDALSLVGATNKLLDQASVFSVLGKHAFTKMGKLKLMSWLAEQEDRVRIILYLADGGFNSPWTQRCIRQGDGNGCEQADCILLVALGDEDPVIGEGERYLLGMKTTARKELVLLHQERSCTPGSTQAWLKNRLWIHAHHHVQMNLNRSSVLGQVSRQNTFVQLKSQLQKYYDRYSNVKAALPSTSTNLGLRSDFARLARRLCGRSIGLVLGGGGARGIAHIGFIRALEEAGVPIDMIGGTSIGSYVGGLYAREVNNVSIYGRAKSFSSRMASLWRKVLDLTYPVTSYLTGHEFNRGIWKSFSDIQIEDLWLNYFCVTTNIVHSRMEIHQSGYLWRYVRASMSLSGFLPPLSDSGNLLVDGGYLNNLPGDVMKDLGAELVIMVDVAAEDDTSPVYFGDSLSGWWVLLNRMNPFRKGPPIPNLAEIQSRLAYVSCIRQLEEAKTLHGCFYLRPPVTQFGTLDFGKFDAIYQVGYRFGQETMQSWAKEGVLELFTGRSNAGGEKRTRRVRRNSI
ncbi:phosphatidylcholine and lysophosphatidylcholine phospholipase [Sorochytrium milnesiophthora]